jgi:hypothetical protein
MALNLCRPNVEMNILSEIGDAQKQGATFFDGKTTVAAICQSMRFSSLRNSSFEECRESGAVHRGADSQVCRGGVHLPSLSGH